MMDESLRIFADEAEDLLTVAEQALLNLDDLNDVDETIGDLFRTFHTIKGAAGLFGLNSIVEFTHVVESLLGNIREGEIKVNDDMVSLFLSSRDHLELLVESALNGEEQLDQALKSSDKDLIAQLNVFLGISSESEPDEDANADENADVSAGSRQAVPKGGVESENWHISLRFGPNALRNGMDPYSFIGYLEKLGEVNSVALIEDAIPDWCDFDPESCYLGFEISLLAPDSNKETIEEVFEFVQDDCKINILPPHSQISAYIKMIEELPEEDMRIGDILVACGALTALEKDNVLNVQDHMADEIIAEGTEKTPPPLGKVAVSEQVVQQEVVDAALKKQSKQKKQVNAQQTIRVNALKLESLVDLVGELVIGSANSEMNARRIGDPILNEAMENLLRLVEEVRDTALGLRMVQIGETFNRFKRVVREVSRDTGKDIELTIKGADTELDKTLIEKIGDPLMHLVRNAIDHGIESPEERALTDKPAKGNVSLDAFHESGSIIIQIKDDGGGLSEQKIVAKAIEKGLIEKNHQLSKKEIFRLIFEAGFSTADTVSNLSGRGVGMDVVRRNIESLRGQIEIDSNQGKGTTISIQLPLTLAIIDGFQVRVGDGHYIIPLDMVDECIELNDTLRGDDKDANYITLRGEVLPFMRLSEIFCPNTDLPIENQATKDQATKDQAIKNDGSEIAQADQEGIDKHRDNIVVVQFGQKKAGFVVDELLGEQQTVIKPLGEIFKNLTSISGATILGSGEVAMIVDVPEMVNRVIKQGNEKHAQTYAAY